MSSTAIEERSVSAGEAAPARLKALFFLSSIDHCRPFESLLRAMPAAGHRVRIALDHQSSGLAGGKTDLLDQLSERYEGFDYQQLRPRRDVWRIPASAARRGLDYLRYLEPGYADADPRREQAREWAPRLLRPLLLVPPFRWGLGRRIVSWLMRRLEAGMPIPRAAKAFISDQAPAVVLVSPLVEFGSAQGDYIRIAEAAGIPSVLLVAAGDDLTSKGAIRDVPTLTVTCNDTQVDEAVRLHGLPAERVVAVGAEVFDGTLAPAAPGAMNAIERVAPTKVRARRKGRLLRPLLWLLTPLLVLLLPVLRPRATARAVVRTSRRLAVRTRKRARALRRTMSRKRAERRKARIAAAKDKRKALAEAREQEKARAAAAKEQEKARAAAAKEEKRARAEAKAHAAAASVPEEASAETKDPEEASAETKEQEEAPGDAG